MEKWKKVFYENCSFYFRIIISYLYEIGWSKITVEEYLKTTKTLSIKDSVFSKNYKKEGKYPIVSQSKELISGYSDNEQLLNKIEKPIIIFGDHTQVVKYIDFDFILGADGTKIITVTEDYHPKFLYYIINSIDLHSNKYARHYSLLRTQVIPFMKDSLVLQENILSFMAHLENETITHTFYFNRKTETKITKLQKSLLQAAELVKEIETQKGYAKQLRRNILQDAIEGKLTADWRKEHPVQKGNSDYDAEALFELIQKERKVDTKRKALPPILDAEKPFELPSGWKWVRLGDVISIETHIVNSSDYLDSIQIAPDDIEKGTGELLENLRTVREKGVISVNHLFSKDALLYSKIRPRLRKIVYVDFEGLCSADMYPLNTRMNKHFIKYLMLSDYFDVEVYKFDNRVKMPKINQSQLSSIKIPIVPLAEQNKIAEKIETVFTKCKQLEYEVSRCKRYINQTMQGVLKNAFGDNAK